MTQRNQQQGDELGWFMTGDRQEIADVLLQFSQELRSGEINVWKGQRELHLDPEGKLELRVEGAAEDEGRQGLNLTLRWTSTSASYDMHAGANMGLELGGDQPKLENT